MKKRSIVMTTAALIVISAITGCTSKAVSSDGTFTPRETANWIVTSSPGDDSGVYIRMISDVMIKEDLVNGQPITITSKTGGGGEIGRNEVAITKGSKVGYVLLTFNSDDLAPMIQNAKSRSSNFRILATMAVDEQLIFRRGQTKYTDFEEAIKATKGGTRIVIGGSKGDDVATYDAVLGETGISKDVMSYIIYDSTSDAITAALGGHVESVISKPTVASGYVTAGSLIPVLASSTERYTGNLTDTSTLSEIGDYENVEVPIWHDVAVPVTMSDATAAYWSEQLGEVAGTNTRENDYLGRNKLTGNYMDAASATEYVTVYEKDFMAANGVR